VREDFEYPFWEKLREKASWCGYLENISQTVKKNSLVII